MLFKEPKYVSGDSTEPVFGFFKVRGGFPSQRDADLAKLDILKNTDSKNIIHTTVTGCWNVLTNSQKFSQKSESIDLDPDTDRREHNDMQKKARLEDEEKIRRELEENKQRLEKTPDLYDDQTNLKFYTLKRVTEMKLTETIETYRNKIAEMEEKRTSVFNEILNLDRKYTNYNEDWLDLYNEERAKVSIPKFLPSGTQFGDLEKYREQNL